MEKKMTRDKLRRAIRQEVKKVVVETLGYDVDDDWSDPDVYVLLRYNNKRSNINNALNLDALDHDLYELAKKYKAFIPSSNMISGWYQVTVMGFDKDVKRAEKFGKEVKIKTKPYSVVIYNIGSDSLVKNI